MDEHEPERRHQQRREIDWIKDQLIVAIGIDGNNGRVGDLRLRMTAAEQEIDGLTKDPGRSDRQEIRMTAIEVRQAATDKTLDRYERLHWKLVTSAMVGGAAVGMLLKAATWIAER